MTRYGLEWPSDVTELDIELVMVRERGLIRGKGNGHTFHYRRAVKLLWPELDSHRWSDLASKELSRPNHKITSFMGPGSTAKTHEAAKWGLVEYFADAENTCVLVSSTDIRGLKLRVWAEIIDLWQKAIDRWPNLPGHMLESRIAITTDALEDGDLSDRKIRDMRKAICGIPCVQDKKYVGLKNYHGIKQKRMRLIADECFPAGTMVDTPRGQVCIETIKPGDFVVSATGINRVRQCSSRIATSLVRVKSKSGKEVVCTPDHPFLTQRGWIKACQLREGHVMLGRYETMSILQGTIPAIQQRQGLSCVQRKADIENMQRLREILSREVCNCRGKILQPVVFQSGAVAGPGVSKEVLYRETIKEDLEYSERLLRQTPGGEDQDDLRYGVSFQEVPRFHDPRAETCLGKKNKRYRKIHGFKTESEGREWDWSHQGRMATVENVSKWGVELSCEDRYESRFWIPDLLQTGPGVAGFETWNRSGRIEPFELEWEEATGPEETEVLRGDWVDSVEVEESGDFGLPKPDPNTRGCRVYNLEVDGHPSYSVNGFIVHNCALMGSSFLKSIANLNNNEDFQAVACFNPSDTLDPGGQISEPVDGWNSHMEPTKTEVWDTRFMGGRCINFVGTDSPNFDDPARPNRYPYLIGPRKIHELVSAFGKDSFEYYSQGVGVMKVGQLSKRVLTRDLCRANGALKAPEWKGPNRTRIYGLDAAYGGDRCIGGWAEFGPDPDGKIILAFHAPRVIHMIAGEEPENVIARAVKDECEALEIPPENMFHDSTGRGSLGTALSRIWSPMTNPVEFGGRPTERPVSLDMYVMDPLTKERRLKLCTEHYDRFVTELWFCVRYAVEGGQIRGLPEDVMDELCTRMWTLKKGDKKSVEPKTGTAAVPGMKERTGRSPDQGDWASIICEGARRKGFMIARLGSNQTYTEGLSWLTDRANGFKSLIKSKQLAIR